jgi:hypothetical protein
MMDVENGKTAGRLQEWQKGVDAKLDKIIKRLDDAFEPQGFCTQARGKVANVNTAIKIYGLLIIGIIIAIITQALR